MQLIYGAILVHRKRRGTLTGGNYARTTNPEGFVEGAYGGAAAHPQPGYYYPPPNASTEYKAQTPAPMPMPTPPPQYGYGPQTTPGSYELDSRPGHV